MTMKMIISIMLAAVIVVNAGYAEAKWWIFGQANDEVSISYLYLNDIPYEESGQKLTVYRDMLPNGEVVLRGKARVGKGKIGGVSVSTDNRETWKEAQLSSGGGFEYRFKPELGKAYLMFVEVVDTAGKANDVESTRKEITVAEGNIQKQVRDLLDAMISAYRSEDSKTFMRYISDDFAGDAAVLERAIRRDFSAFDNIDLRYSPNNIASGKNGIFASISFSRQVMSSKTGKTYSDRGITEFVIKPTAGGLKVFSMKFPLIFGLSNSADVATGSVNSGNNEPVIVVSSGGDVATVPYNDALSGVSAASTVESGSATIVSLFHPPTGFDFSIGASSSSTSASFVLTGGVNGSAYGFLGMGHAFKDLGAVSINSITEAPADGYSADTTIGYYFVDGHTYAFKSPNGKYALMYVRLVTHYPPSLPANPNPVISMQINYKYQPNGSRNF